MPEGAAAAPRKVEERIGRMAEHKNGMEAKRGMAEHGAARFCRIASKAFRTWSGPNRPAAANGVKLGRGYLALG